MYLDPGSPFQPLVTSQGHISIDVFYLHYCPPTATEMILMSLRLKAYGIRTQAFPAFISPRALARSSRLQDLFDHESLTVYIYPPSACLAGQHRFSCCSPILSYEFLSSLTPTPNRIARMSFTRIMLLGLVSLLAVTVDAASLEKRTEQLENRQAGRCQRVGWVPICPGPLPCAPPGFVSS